MRRLRQPKASGCAVRIDRWVNQCDILRSIFVSLRYIHFNFNLGKNSYSLLLHVPLHSLFREFEYVTKDYKMQYFQFHVLRRRLSSIYTCYFFLWSRCTHHISWKLLITWLSLFKIFDFWGLRYQFVFSYWSILTPIFAHQSQKNSSFL